MDCMGEPSMNEFQADLAFSLEKNTDESINDRYFQAFPHLAGVEVVTDIEIQKKGIDKVFHFESGNTANVDEKKRRFDYGDILLEEYSDFDKKKIGWLGRDKYTDYIAYIIEGKKLFLFPFLILQRVWLNNYKEWIVRFGRKFADNGNYRTSNIAIPTNILMDELQEAYQLSL